MTPSETIAQARQILEEVAAGQGDPTELLVMAGAVVDSSPEAAEILKQAFRAITGSRSEQSPA
jgi:hypothetical protein